MVNKQPLVSAIVPAYNAAATIERVIQGLLQQTYPNIEIIVVNDGSTDTTQSVVEKIAKQDNRVRLINQSNAGPGAARNKGIENVSGEFVMFFDADDDFDLTIIQIMVREQQKNAADLVVCGMTINDRVVNAQSMMIIHNDKIVRYALISLLKKNLMYGPYCKLYKRDILDREQVRFNTDMKYGEDTVFVMEYLSVIDRLRIISESLYRYFYSVNGIAFQNRNNRYDRSLRRQGLLRLIRKRLKLGNVFLAMAVMLRWGLSSLKARMKNE